MPLIVCRCININFDQAHIGIMQVGLHPISIYQYLWMRVYTVLCHTFSFEITTIFDFVEQHTQQDSISQKKTRPGNYFIPGSPSLQTLTVEATTLVARFRAPLGPDALLLLPVTSKSLLQSTLVQRRRVIPSTPRGKCYDNARASGFFATLECELLDPSL